jgi:hypothetical protein
VRPSRSIALFALVAIVLLRSVGFAADAWTANAVECCCGRHAADHDCGCDQCPSHHHGKRTDDHRAHLRSCSHHVTLATVVPVPNVTAPAGVPAIAPARSTPRALATFVSPESQVVHPETPPS